MDTNTISLIVIAVLNAITAWLSYRTHQSTVASSSTIDMLERNTNSIKDALVASTAKASFSAGENQARVVAEQKASDLKSATLEAEKPKAPQS